MAALRLALALAAVCLPAVARADALPWRPLIDEASERFGIPTLWIEKVMMRESGGRTALGGRPIVSPAGAMGLMQVMPGTWAAMRSRLGLGADPHDPRDNILAGTLYLRLMYEQFGYPGLFAAYNAGPGRYSEYLRAGRPLPAETRAYVAALTAYRDNSGQRPAPARIGADALPWPSRSAERNVIFFALRSAVLQPAGERSPEGVR